MILFFTKNLRWLFAGALLALSSSFGQTFLISVFAGEIQTAFNLSHGDWGRYYFIGTIASAICVVWAGTLTDVFRVRILGPMCMAGLAIACFLMATNPFVWLLPIVVFLLRFFGQGMLSHIAVVAMSRWFSKNRGKALSFSTIGYAMGESFLPMTLVFLLGFFAWQALWIGFSIVLFLAIPVLLLLLRKERSPAEVAEEQQSVGMNGKFWTRSECLRHWLFWCMVPAVVAPSCFSTALFFHQVHLAELKGVSHLTFASFFPVYASVSVGMMLLSGWALDILGTKRLLPFLLIPTAIGFYIFGTIDGTTGIAIGFVFLALTQGMNSTLPNAFWTEFYGNKHIGAIKSAAAAFMVLGSAIGPWVTGAMIDQGIGFETQLKWFTLVFLIAAAITTFGVRKAARLLPVTT